MQVEDKAIGSDLVKAIETIALVAVGERLERRMHPTFVRDIFLVTW